MKKFFLRIALWLLMPLLMLECTVRMVPVFNTLYMKKIDPYISLADKQDKRKIIFIGSSRVAASIRTEIINRHFSHANVYAVNAGRGMETGMIHYLALKKLERDRQLKNATVYVEAPGGMSSYNEDCRSNWVDSRNIHLIIPFLNRDLLLDFWKYSGNDFQTKLIVTVDFCLHSFRIYSLAKEILKKRSPAEMWAKIKGKGHDQALSNDMAEGGGIKVDSVSIKMARKLAIEEAKHQIRQQKVITRTDWDKSILYDMHKLLEKNKAELVLFDMPVSSVQDKVYATEIARDNIKTFQQFLSDNEIEFFDPGFTRYTDLDFPDLWHISLQKSKEFTSRVMARL